MSDLDVGKTATYHSPWGDFYCVITDYEAGKDAGDHRVAGFTNAAAKADGQGLVFAEWTVVGTEQGAITIDE